MTSAEVLSFVDRRLDHESRVTTLIANHNLHSLYLAEKNPEFRRILRDADIVLLDGWPLRLLTRTGKGAGLVVDSKRVGSTDWIHLLVGLNNVTSLALVGGSVEAGSKMVSLLSERSRGTVTVRHWPGTDWSQELETRIRGEVIDFQPDVLLIGLGMPLQETVVDRSFLDAGIPVVATVGGAFDQLTGIQKPTPEILRRHSLEAPYRLLTQPRRLWFRYLAEPPLTVGMIIRRRFRSKAAAKRAAR